MMKPIGRLCLVLGCALPHLAQATPPPPKYVELTAAVARELGFEYQVWRKDGYSYIELSGPARIGDRLHAHSTDVITRDLKGEVRQSTRSGTRLAYPSVANRFDHRQVDMSVSITYCEIPVQACVGYWVESASAFVRKHAGADRPLPEPGISRP